MKQHPTVLLGWENHKDWIILWALVEGPTPTPNAKPKKFTFFFLSFHNGSTKSTMTTISFVRCWKTREEMALPFYPSWYFQSLRLVPKNKNKNKTKEKNADDNPSCEIAWCFFIFILYTVRWTAHHYSIKFYLFIYWWVREEKKKKKSFSRIVIVGLNTGLIINPGNINKYIMK